MYLYVIKECMAAKKSERRPSMLKIGITKDPDDRMKGLQTSNPSTLTFLHLVKCKSEQHAREMEKTIHGKLAQFHIRGEWFRGDAIGRFVKLMAGRQGHGCARLLADRCTTETAVWELI